MIGLYRFSWFPLGFFMVLKAQDPRVKPDQAVGPESTVVSTCLQPIRIMLYGTISDHMEFHGEISAFMWNSCIMELALGPFGPQTSLSSPVLLLESSWKHLGSISKALGSLWRALAVSWSHLEPS